jgi:formylglycine-generating enzyme
MSEANEPKGEAQAMSSTQPATAPVLRQVPTAGMTWIPGGEFQMGSADFYPEERPVHTVAVAGFWMDTRPVTIAEFRRFVKQTGYVTAAEQASGRAADPGADPELMTPGSLVFRMTAGPVDFRDCANWWSYVPGACWRRPEGPGSDVLRRDKHPVTHVTYADAQAYAAWAGKELPTEAQWEYAARGGLDGAAYVWGDELAPAGQLLANIWHGEFPWQNLVLDGYAGTSPVASFPPNGFGLYDMTGNVWEWTADIFRQLHWSDRAGPPGGFADRPCGPPRRPLVGDYLADPFPDATRQVIKGGSHLCAPTYCLRSRPAARQGEATDTSTCHLGFRCVLRLPS